MIIEFLSIKNGNYHEKQISYADTSNEISEKSLDELRDALTSFYSTRKKPSLRDDTWDNNYPD